MNARAEIQPSTTVFPAIKDGAAVQNVFALRGTVYLKVLVFPSQDMYVNLYFGVWIRSNLVILLAE